MVPVPQNRKLSQAYNPTTFLERGVLVPFTTPLLAGTRTRPGEREGLDLIVPNPSGGQGVYILPWDGVRELCRPTVHDVKLHEKVSQTPSVSPSSIRQAARAIAAEGLAGREARAAAAEAAEAEKQDHVLANFLLVMALVQQIEPKSGEGQAPPEKIGWTKWRRGPSRRSAPSRPAVGKSPEAVAAQLEELAVVFDGVGVEPYATQSRLARATEALRRFHVDMVAWSGAHIDESREQASLIARVAELTLDWAQRTLAEAVALTANVPHLLRRWESEPELIGRHAARPDWLLDGWDQIRLLWETASSPDERRAVLPELVALVPLIPREASDWVGVEIAGDHPARLEEIGWPERGLADGKSGARSDRAQRARAVLGRHERIRGMPATLGELNRDLSSAKDAKIAQVVAIVDRLQDRGDADRLIAPLRGRLAQLRPARPLRFSRLLFLPLDPLIVSPSRWRPDALTIPRTAIAPLATTLRAVLPAGWSLGSTPLSPATARQMRMRWLARGAILWPAAGLLLIEPPPTQNWEATGLPHAAYKPLAQAAGALLIQAVALHDLQQAARCGCKPDTLAGERMMQASSAFGPVAMARMLTLVLASLPDAAALLRAAETRAGLTQAGGRAAADSAVTFFLDRLEDGDAAASPLATCGLQTRATPCTGCMRC